MLRASMLTPGPREPKFASISFFAASVTSATTLSRLATAKAAVKLYSL
jgi:hypothetical protein